MFVPPLPSSRNTLLSAMALAPVLLLTGCDDKAKPVARDDARPVLVAKVHYAPRAPARSFVGVIRPRIETDLGFRVAGKVARRLVEVGETVEAGQPVAVLDELDLRLQAEQAEAERQAATGVLAQAAAAEARTRELRGRGWATDAQMEQARASGDEARARLRRAERAVELTRNSLSYARLVADARGVVTATMVEPGQVVAAGQAAIRVARETEKEVVVSLPEFLVDRARGGAARVSLWSAPDRQYVASLREMAPAADPATRTYLAKYRLEGAGDDVRLGMTATLTLVDPASESVARVPLAAVFNQGEGPSLFVVNKGSGAVTPRRVVVASYESADALIASGVDEGDEVVALGVQKIDPARKVRVVSALSF
jgi:RND family efflux transporter MFP subunit